MAFLIVLSAVGTTSLGNVIAADSLEDDDEYSIIWDFEDGELAPFKLVSGSYGNIISDIPYNHGGDTASIFFREGKYNLSTYETTEYYSKEDAPEKFGKAGTKMTKPSSEYICEIHSPMFRLTDAKVNFLIGGGSSDKTFVALCDLYGNEVRIATGNDSETMIRVEWDLTYDGVVGEYVFIKIVDNRTDEWGYITFDDFCANGEVDENKTIENVDDMIYWNFENGALAPFEVVSGALGECPIVCWDKERNYPYGEINKQGDYYLSTVDVDNTLDNYEHKIMAEIRSPIFKMKDPTFSLKIGGGTSDKNYVAIVRVSDGKELVRYHNTTFPTYEFDANSNGIIDSGETYSSGNMFTNVTITVPEELYSSEDSVYLKIVDGDTAGWGFILVDDIRIKGEIDEDYSLNGYTYESVIWSFEQGTIFPFKTEQVWGAGIIASTADGNGTQNSIPHGSLYLNSVLTDPDDATRYNESFTGEFVSPVFILNPDEPYISMDLNGGGVKSYVSVCDANTGKEIAKIKTSLNSWEFTHVEIDLTGKFDEGDELIIKLVDDTIKGWAWFGVDNIRGSFCFPALDSHLTVEQLMDDTGWQEEDFEGLITKIEDFMVQYSEEEYPDGEVLLDAVNAMRRRLERIAKIGDTSELLEKWIEDMEGLEDRINASNPALGSGFMIFTVHYQYKTDHHNTHNMFPAYNGEISDKTNFTPGGAVKIMNLRTGEVTTLLEDPDGLYRDLDVSYDSDRILLSYRENRDSVYNIVEYTLSDDRLSVVSTKQLTSLSTADDMDPMYMPSGNIVFSSTRDPKYVMCNRHIAANIYRMESDGANIVKITSSTLFERPTDVLPDGRILYDRWEYNDRDFGSAQGLWTVYEDGTKQDTYYGNNSPTGAVIDAKAIPGTQKVLAVLTSTHDVSWGALAVIDRSLGVDGQDAVEMTWPASVKSAIGEPGDSINIDAYVKLGVKYEDPQPLDENYFLVSRTIPGRNNKMGIYLVDVYGNETLLYEDDSDMSAFDATIIQPREEEMVTSERRNYNDDVGTFFVQDVYQGTHMEGVERGEVKTLRIVESVDKKYISQSAQWGAQGQQNPGVNWHSFEVKRVIGEVPVYEDGSAYFEVPQDTFVYFQLLDKDGRMIQSMRSGTLVQSGETTGCVGCHEDRKTTPSTSTGYDTPIALKANIKVIDNPEYTEGSDLPKTIAVNTPDVPQKRELLFEMGEDILTDWDCTDLPTMNFLTEVQPIFTKNCLQCHGYEKKEANLSLVPDKDVIFNAAYINLWVDRNISGVPFENLLGAIGAGDTTFYNAKDWGSYNSPLIKMIYEDEAHASRLTDAEKRRIAEWVDLNATYYGDYDSNYSYNNGGRSPLTYAERQQIGDTRQFNFSSFNLNSLNSAIYFDNPELSPILKGKTGEAYDKALALIEEGLKRLRTNPDTDWKGLTSVPGNPLLGINSYKQCEMNAWRTEKVALYDAMEAANRAAIVNGTKLYDEDHEEAMSSHNKKWPGWPTKENPGHAYSELPDW